MIFRKATLQDIDFVIKAIIEAEKSGSDTISYCALFSISEEELRVILKNMLEEEMEGQELCIDNFVIAEIDGMPAGTLSAWVEGETGMASNLIKSNMFMYFVDRTILMNATDNMKLLTETGIDRDNEALQIECVYTAPQYRGMGITRYLIDEQIRLNLASGKKFAKVQIILLKNNESAVRAYQKGGFSVVREKTAQNELILNLLPCATKILMEKNI